MRLQLFFQLLPRSQQSSGAVPVFDACYFKYSPSGTNNRQLICPGMEFEIPNSRIRMRPIVRLSNCVFLGGCNRARDFSDLCSGDTVSKSIPVIGCFNAISCGKKLRKRFRW